MRVPEPGNTPTKRLAIENFQPKIKQLLKILPTKNHEAEENR